MGLGRLARSPHAARAVHRRPVRNRSTSANATRGDVATRRQQRYHRRFLDVGRELAVIRDQRLYRQTHDTFEACCDERWDISRPHAYELISAAQTVTAMSAVADTPLPANERAGARAGGCPGPVVGV